MKWLAGTLVGFTAGCLVTLMVLGGATAPEPDAVQAEPEDKRLANLDPEPRQDSTNAPAPWALPGPSPFQQTSWHDGQILSASARPRMADTEIGWPPASAMGVYGEVAEGLRTLVMDVEVVNHVGTRGGLLLEVSGLVDGEPIRYESVQTQTPGGAVRLDLTDVPAERWSMRISGAPGSIHPFSDIRAYVTLFYHEPAPEGWSFLA